MKTNAILLTAYLAILVPAVCLAQNGHDLFQKALVKERTEGDLEAAIQLHQQIVDECVDDRPLAAKALLHMGLCREKLGHQEALSIYRRVVDQYPEQREAVSKAKERISELSDLLEDGVKSPVFQRIHIPYRISQDAQLSPDGKDIALVSGKQLWIVPRSSRVGADHAGTPKPIDTAGLAADWCGLTWSADGQWIAFNGAVEEEGRQGIYVVPAEGGGTPRKVHENDRSMRVGNYRMSLSPHGETLAFASADADELHLYTARVDGGPPRRLVDAPAREPVFSPDGKTIAYVEDKNLGLAGGGLWIVPTDGGAPILVAEAENASSPVWSPDGSMLAFIDYAAASRIHIVTLNQEGGRGGNRIVIDCPEGLGEAVCLSGWTSDNELGAVCSRKPENALYAMPLQEGKPSFVTYGGNPIRPHWFPDGERIIYLDGVNEPNRSWELFALTHVSAEGGTVTTVPLRAETKIVLWNQGTGNLVSPDGETIVFAGQKPQNQDPSGRRHKMHIWTVPVHGGTPRQLTDAPARIHDWHPCWAPHGRTIAFVRAQWPENWATVGKANVCIVPVGGGEARQITSESDHVFAAGPVVWSPNGEQLAFLSREKEDSVDGTLRVIPVTGGQSRAVAKVDSTADSQLVWSSSGLRIVYSEGGKIRIVSVEGGKTEEIDPGLDGVSIYHADLSPRGEGLVFAGSPRGGREFWMISNFLPALASAD